MRSLLVERGRRFNMFHRLSFAYYKKNGYTLKIIKSVPTYSTFAPQKDHNFLGDTYQEVR